MVAQTWVRLKGKGPESLKKMVQHRNNAKMVAVKLEKGAFLIDNLVEGARYSDQRTINQLNGASSSRPTSHAKENYIWATLSRLRFYIGTPSWLFLIPPPPSPTANVKDNIASKMPVHTVYFMSERKVLYTLFACVDDVIRYMYEFIILTSPQNFLSN